MRLCENDRQNFYVKSDIAQLSQKKKNLSIPALTYHFETLCIWSFYTIHTKDGQFDTISAGKLTFLISKHLKHVPKQVIFTSPGYTYAVFDKIKKVTSAKAKQAACLTEKCAVSALFVMAILERLNLKFDVAVYISSVTQIGQLSSPHRHFYHRITEWFGHNLQIYSFKKLLSSADIFHYRRSLPCTEFWKKTFMKKNKKPPPKQPYSLVTSADKRSLIIRSISR